MKYFKTLILLVILLAVRSSGSYAQSFRRQGLYYWINQETKEARISNADHRDSLIVPDSIEYDGVQYPVVELGNSAYIGNTMKKLVIGKNVRSIGIGLCQVCQNLTSVIWSQPSAIESVEEYAFGSCYSLVDCKWPENISEIKKGMFSQCAFESYTIPRSVTLIGEFVFYASENLKHLYCDSEIPPTVSDNTFFMVSYSDVTIHVPQGSMNTPVGGINSLKNVRK